MGGDTCLAICGTKLLCHPEGKGKEKQRAASCRQLSLLLEEVNEATRISGVDRKGEMASIVNLETMPGSSLGQQWTLQSAEELKTGSAEPFAHFGLDGTEKRGARGEKRCV
jgi:hypothetical protein